MPVLEDIKNGLLKYATNAYIAEYPSVITLNRKTKVAKAGGGHDKVDVALPPQNFRLVNQTVNGGLSFSGNDGGATHQYQFIMVGAFDADVQVDDTWSETGAHFHVDGIMPNTGYETRAAVTAFSEEPLHG